MKNRLKYIVFSIILIMYFVMVSVIIRPLTMIITGIVFGLFLYVLFGKPTMKDWEDNFLFGDEILIYLFKKQEEYERRT